MKVWAKNKLSCAYKMTAGLKSNTLPVNVKGCDDLREGHVCSYGAGNSHLVDLQVGVRCDDSTGREVHTLTHQITSDTSFLTLKPLFEGFQRAPRLLHCLKTKQKAKVYITVAFELQCVKQHPPFFDIQA